MLREHIKEALNKNLDEICFTDHRDFNYPIDPFELDTVSYFKELKDLQKEYQNKISIKIGLEIGLDMNHFKEINDFVNADDYDWKYSCY